MRAERVCFSCYSEAASSIVRAELLPSCVYFVLDDLPGSLQTGRGPSALYGGSCQLLQPAT
jgi:hypothetical protein